jgi:hypothetical protein
MGQHQKCVWASSIFFKKDGVDQLEFNIVGKWGRKWFKGFFGGRGGNGPPLSYLSNSFSMSPTCTSIPKLLKFGFRLIKQTRFENIIKDGFLNL